MGGWRTWTSSSELWGGLSPYQKAAAMSLMEADAANPDDARNALGAMINRAAKSGQDLGFHVSQRIYQPTIEPAQQARLPRILAHPEFGNLTAWAERRAAGQEADPVSGATHFLAKPEVMLALERREPGKYRNWGPRGANWTGYDPQTGQYKNQTFADRSHAFLAPDGTYSVPSTPPGDPTAQDNAGFGYAQTPPPSSSPPSRAPAVAGYQQSSPPGDRHSMADDKEPGFFDRLAGHVAYNPLVSGGLGMLIAAAQGKDWNAGLDAGTKRADANTRDFLLKRDAAIKAFRERQWEQQFGPNATGVPSFLKDTPEAAKVIYSLGPDQGAQFMSGLLARKFQLEQQMAEEARRGSQLAQTLPGTPQAQTSVAPAVPAPVERGPIPPAQMPPQAAQLPPQLGGQPAAPAVDPQAAARALMARQNGVAAPQPQQSPSAQVSPAAQPGGMPPRALPAADLDARATEYVNNHVAAVQKQMAALIPTIRVGGAAGHDAYKRYQELATSLDPAALENTKLNFFKLEATKRDLTTPKDDFKEIGTDQYGNKQFGFVNTATRQVTPAQAPEQGGSSGLTGEEYLKTLPAGRAAQVKAVIEGRMQPPGSFALKSPQIQRLLADVGQVEPGFDLTNWARRAQTAKSFAPGGKDNAIVTALNTTLGHINGLNDLVDELGNSDFVPGVTNPVANAVGKQFSRHSQEVQSKFEITKNAVADELEKAFRGSGGSVSGIEAWKKSFNVNDSKTAQKAAIRAAIELLDSQLQTRAQNYNQGYTGGKQIEPRDLLLPKNREIVDKIEGKNPGGGVGLKTERPAGKTDAQIINDANKLIQQHPDKRDAVIKQLGLWGVKVGG